MNGPGWKALKQIRDCKDYIKYVKKNEVKLILSLEEREMVEGWLDIANDVQGDLTYDVSTLEAVHAEILNMSKRFPREIDDEDDADPWGSDDSKGVGFKSEKKDDLEPEEILRNPHYQTGKDEEKLNDKGSGPSAPPPQGRGTTSGIRVGVQNEGGQRPYFGRGRGAAASNGHVKSPGPGPVPMAHNQPGAYTPPNAPTTQPMNGHQQAYRIPQPQPFNGNPRQVYNVPLHLQSQPLNGYSHCGPLHQSQPLNGQAHHVPLHWQSPTLNGQAYNVPFHPQSQPLNGQAHNVPLHPQPQIPNSPHLQYNFPHHPQPNYQQSFPQATYIPTGVSGNGTQMNHTRQFVYDNQAPAPVPAPQDPRLNSLNRPGQPYAPRVQSNGMPTPTMQQQTFLNSSQRGHIMSPSSPMPNYPEYEPDFVPEPQRVHTFYSIHRTLPLNTSQSNQQQPQRTTYRDPKYQNFAANRQNSSGRNSIRPNGQLGKFGKPKGNQQFHRPQNSSRPFSANNNFGSNNNVSSNPAQNDHRPTTASTQQSTIRRKTPSSSTVRASLEMNTGARDNTIESDNVEDMNGAGDSDENSAGEGVRVPLKKNSRAFENVTEWRKSLVEQNEMYRLGTKSKNNVVEVSQEEIAQPAKNLQPEPAKKTTKNKKTMVRKTTKNSSTSQRRPVKLPGNRATKSREDEDDDANSADDFQPEKRGQVKIKLPFNTKNTKKLARPKPTDTEEPIAHCSKDTPAPRAQAPSKPRKRKPKAAAKPSSSQPKNSPAKRSRRPQLIYSDEEEEIERSYDPYMILIASEQLEQVRPLQIQATGMYQLEDILPYLKIIVLEFRKARSLVGASKFLEKPTNFQRFLTAVAELLDEAIEPELMCGQGVPADLCVRAERPEGRVLRARCIPKELKLTPTFVKYLEHVYQDWWLPMVAVARSKETDSCSNSQPSRKRSGSTAKDDAKKAKKVDQTSTTNNLDSTNGISKNGSIVDDVNGSQEQLGNGTVNQEEYAVPGNVFAASEIDAIPALVVSPTSAPVTTAGPQGTTTASVQVEVKTEIKIELDDSDYDELPAEVLENLNMVPDVQ